MKHTIEGYHRAKAMLPQIREFITRAAVSTDMKREALADELLIGIKKDFPKEIPPKIETIIKLISKARNPAKDPINEPWHLGILNKIHDYGIPYISADGIDAIMRVQHWLSNTWGRSWVDVHVKKKNITKLGYGTFALLFNTLSIRQAKWIATLYQTTGNDPQYLWLVSFYYSYHEIISNISNTPFDTRTIDYHLCHGKPSFLNMLKANMPYELNIFGQNLEKALNILMETGRIKGEDK
jgi:hypothetical protein